MFRNFQSVWQSFKVLQSVLGCTRVFQCSSLLSKKKNNTSDTQTKSGICTFCYWVLEKVLLERVNQYEEQLTPESSDDWIDKYRKGFHLMPVLLQAKHWRSMWQNLTSQHCGPDPATWQVLADHFLSTPIVSFMCVCVSCAYVVVPVCLSLGPITRRVSQASRWVNQGEQCWRSWRAGSSKK